MFKIDMRVGTRFIYNGAELEVKETGRVKSCAGCYFRHDENGCQLVECIYLERADGKSVIFEPAKEEEDEN